MTQTIEELKKEYAAIPVRDMSKYKKRPTVVTFYFRNEKSGKVFMIRLKGGLRL